jgi:hypothetical protein
VLGSKYIVYLDLSSEVAYIVTLLVKAYKVTLLAK